MIGPMFYGFAQWVYEHATEKGLDKVYFLARDGEIIKECYDVICASKENAPKSEYVHVSRRALSVPSIKTTQDIIEMAKINFSPISIKKLMKSRFGLDDVILSKNALKSCGFNSSFELINSNRDGEQFAELCVLIKDQILAHAEVERENMVDYLHSKGLDGKQDTIVVDIGHNGTLQKRMNRLLETDKIDGLYFVTHSGVKETIHDNGWSAKGYVGEEINGSDKRYPYNKYLLMFEACFLNQEGSTVSINRLPDGGFKPNQLSVENESERIDFIKRAHSGVVDFAKDVVAISDVLNIDIKIQGRESINPYLAMLSHPYELDLLMFNKVAFENVYSGRDNKYLVSYNAESREETFEDSYWKDHLDVLDWSDSKDHLRGGRVKALIVLAMHVGHKFNLITKRKLEKFERTPRRFFEDSKNPIIRRLAKQF
jgi:predicted HAD superfamily hydrolase